LPMPTALARKFTLNDLRADRASGTKLAMLTCYDFTTARLMEEVGVPMLLVGDSAGSVILGHPSTLPTPLDFLIELTAAVRRGSPNCFLVGDMPFGSYQGSVARGVKNACLMVQRSHCDCVKLEVASSHLRLVRELADAGVAVMAHIGLRPQAVGLLGGYKYQGRTADEAMAIVDLALQMQAHGAAAILLEAVPAEVSAAVVKHTNVPVVGCGAGPACHGHVVVTSDMLGLTPHRPKFVPLIDDLAEPATAAFAEYVRRISTGDYPTDQHQYQMSEPEQMNLAQRLKLQHFFTPPKAAGRTPKPVSSE
jgi:3-methyl-2-oxobutanoate hydroxymethyltransferase